MTPPPYQVKECLYPIAILYSLINILSPYKPLTVFTDILFFDNSKSVRCTIYVPLYTIRTMYLFDISACLFLYRESFSTLLHVDTKFIKYSNHLLSQYEVLESMIRQENYITIPNCYHHHTYYAVMIPLITSRYTVEDRRGVRTELA